MYDGNTLNAQTNYVQFDNKTKKQTIQNKANTFIHLFLVFCIFKKTKNIIKKHKNKMQRQKIVEFHRKPRTHTHTHTKQKKSKYNKQKNAKK